MKFSPYNIFSIEFYGKKFWTEGHFYRSVGAVNAETMKHYVEDCQEKHWEKKKIRQEQAIILQKNLFDF